MIWRVQGILTNFDGWNQEDKYIIKKLKKLFHGPRHPSLKEKMSMALYVLESTSKKLQYLTEGLKTRSQRIFEKCIKAEAAGNHIKAVIYANECAKVRKIARVIVSSEIALERAILRFQTINKLGDVLATITPIVELVEETKGRLSKTIPSIASKLNGVNSVLKSSLLEMGSVNGTKDVRVSTEAFNILKEANMDAEEKIRERFPDLPQDLETPELIKSRIPIALTTNGSYEIENKDLLKAYGGEIKLVNYAAPLDVLTKDVKKPLSEMKK